MCCIHNDHVLDAVDTHVAERSLASTLMIDGEEAGHGLPPHMIPLAELRDIVLDAATDPEVKESIWCQVVTQVSKGDEDWLLGAVWLMVPGLRKITNQISAGIWAIQKDIESEVIEGFIEGLRAADPEQGELSSHLFRSARRRGVNVRRSYLDRQRREVSTEREGLTEPYEGRAYRGDILAGAIYGGVLSATEADLIGRTRVEGERLGAVAQRMGLNYGACCQRRARAESRLLGYLSAEEYDTRAWCVPAPRTPSQRGDAQ